MQQFLFYSLVSAFFWGVMATVESVAGQYQMHSTLLVKSLLYGIVGSALVLYLRGLSTVQSNIITFVKDRPQLLALLCAGVTAGVFGTYFLYCSFDSCGENKALAVIISYCVPVVIVALLSYFALGERYNAYAVLGVVMILAGVLLIDVLGVEDSGGE